MTTRPVGGRSRRARAADPARRRRRDALLGVVVVALVAIVAWLSTVAIDGGPFSDPYAIRVAVPAGAPLLKDGDEVKIAGQRAGTVRRVERGPDGGPLATLELDDGPVGADATARVRLRGVAGAVYVELDPGTTDGPRLADGATLRTPVRAAVQLSDVAATFDATTRRAVRRTVGAFGRGLRSGEGGARLNATLAELPGTLRALTPIVAAAVPREGGLRRLLDDADGVLGALDPATLRTLVPAARATLEALPDAELDATLSALPGTQARIDRTLPGATRLLDEAGRTAEDLRPATAALRAALPTVRRVLGRDEDVRRFAALADRTTPVLAAATPVLRDARPAAALLRPLAEPLGPLSSFLVPYREDIVEAVTGFTRWGDFRFDDGQAKGARAVRFSMVLTCHNGRDPYPAPGAASKERKPC